MTSGKGLNDSLTCCFCALPLQCGRADLQVSERPLKIQLEFKCGARYCAVGDLIRLRFGRFKRGKRRDLLSVEKELIARPLGLNQECVALRHPTQLRKPWPAKRRACAS